MREYDDVAPKRGKRSRYDDDQPLYVKRQRREEPEPSDVDGPESGDRWSNWDDPGVLTGPEPYPDWVVTEMAAVDTELGVLKTGKEADVYLVERGIPGTERTCLLAAKRYRMTDHRLFHRDAGYLEGRRERESRVSRAMATKTAFGRQAGAGKWASAEFEALKVLWEVGAEFGRAIVPYPVQLVGTELLLEFIGEPDGVAAPRLAQLRPPADELADLWRQLVEALEVLARIGWAHGDLSPYNILVHKGRLVLIDLPQVVDIVGNPRGRDFLARDVAVVTNWFAARGLPAELADARPLTASLLQDAGVR
jgi:RIO kinase 1